MALGAGVAFAGLFGLAAALSVDEDHEATRIDRPETTTTTERERDVTPPAVDEPAAPATTTTAPATPAEVGTSWFRWDDGLEAQVISIEQFTPDYDSTPTPDVVVTVTVKNGTGKVYDATMASMNLYGGPNGVQAEGEYTFYGFDGSIPVGATATAKWSFTVPPEHLGDLMVEFAPGWGDDYSAEYDSAFFHGSAV